jgi:hypothetical protein
LQESRKGGGELGGWGRGVGKGAGGGGGRVQGEGAVEGGGVVAEFYRVL